MYLIQLKSISKNYHLDGHAVHALKSINLNIEAGSMLAIMGASGSGKSTLMNIMGFLDQPSSGQYLFEDKDMTSLDQQALTRIRNQKIGFIFQSFFLLPRQTALENIMLPLFYRRMNEKEARECALAKMHQLHIAHLQGHYPRQLSGGQQQRVAIARALVQEPTLILADEPTGALDSTTGTEVMQILCELHLKEQRTIVIITHDEAVSRYCQRVITIQDGAIVSDIEH